MISVGLHRTRVASNRILYACIPIARYLRRGTFQMIFLGGCDELRGEGFFQTPPVLFRGHVRFSLPVLHLAADSN